MSSSPTPFGRLLGHWRKARRLSQEALAGDAEACRTLGWSQQGGRDAIAHPLGDHPHQQPERPLTLGAASSSSDKSGERPSQKLDELALGQESAHALTEGRPTEDRFYCSKQ